MDALLALLVMLQLAALLALSGLLAEHLSDELDGDE